jgi:hypothetical protein
LTTVNNLTIVLDRKTLSSTAKASNEFCVEAWANLPSSYVNTEFASGSSSEPAKSTEQTSNIIFKTILILPCLDFPSILYLQILLPNIAYLTFIIY